MVRTIIVCMWRVVQIVSNILYICYRFLANCVKNCTPKWCTRKKAQNEVYTIFWHNIVLRHTGLRQHSSTLLQHLDGFAATVQAGGTHRFWVSTVKSNARDFKTLLILLGRKLENRKWSYSAVPIFAAGEAQDWKQRSHINSSIPWLSGSNWAICEK